MMHRFPSGLAGDKVHQKRVPGGAPPWLETVRVHFPRYGQHADELCVTELRPGDLGGADVDGGVPPVELAPGRHREARRVAHRPRPDAGLPPGEGEGGRRRRARGAGRAGRGRLAEDVRGPGAARLRPHRPGARLHRRAAGGAGVREGDRAPGAPAGDDHVVAQGQGPGQAVRGLQPERPGPHDGGGLLGAGPADGHGVDADRLGRGARRRARRLHDGVGARPVRGAGRPPRGHRRRRVRHRRAAGVGRARRARRRGRRRPAGEGDDGDGDGSDSGSVPPRH